MKTIITGATGMVGSEVLNQALQDDSFEEVTAIVRRPLTIQHKKLKVVIHKDFLNYSGLEDTFRNNDACMWCLGISQNQVKEAEYIVITHDYTIAAAKAMLEANPGITMLFLSGEGANAEEKGCMLFGRVKGKTENALLKMPFSKLYIARPAGILPVNSSIAFPLVLRLQYAFVSVMRFITPRYVITSTKLAKALLLILKNGAAKTILSYRDINDLAK